MPGPTPVPHYNYFPPAGAVIDQNDSRATWDGRAWKLNGKVYTVPSSHRLVGKPGGPLNGWSYDWQRHAWMEPGRAPSPSPPRPAAPMAPRMPIVPKQQPQQQPPARMPEKKESTMMVEKKDGNVLEYLMKHPVAPLLGGFLLLGSQFAEEPVPPTITEALPETVAKQWQMIYAQNLQRFQRRMDLFQNVGKLLLGYADTNALLAALPPKTK